MRGTFIKTLEVIAKKDKSIFLLTEAISSINKGGELLPLLIKAPLGRKILEAISFPFKKFERILDTAE